MKLLNFIIQLLRYYKYAFNALLYSNCVYSLHPRITIKIIYNFRLAKWIKDY